MPGQREGAGGTKRSREPEDNGLFECCVCLEDMAERQPRFLHCMHTCCTRCLQDMARENRIICPECRKQTVLPPGGVPDLPINCYLIKMRDREHKLSKTTAFCGICLTRTTPTMKRATHLCHTCTHRMCGVCATMHSTAPVFTAHTVVPLVNKGDSTGAKCPNHNGEISFVCLVCYKELCVMCVHDPEHKEHQDKIKEFTQGKYIIQSSRDKSKKSLDCLHQTAINVLEGLTRDHQNVKKMAVKIKSTYDQVCSWQVDIEDRQKEIGKILEILPEKKMMMDCSSCRTDAEAFQKIKQNKEEADKTTTLAQMVIQTSSYTVPDDPDTETAIPCHAKFYVPTFSNAGNHILDKVPFEDKDKHMSSVKPSSSTNRMPASVAAVAKTTGQSNMEVVNRRSARSKQDGVFGKPKGMKFPMEILDPEFLQRKSSCSCDGITRLFEILPWEDRYWYDETRAYMIDDELANILKAPKEVYMKSAGNNQVILAVRDGRHVAYLNPNGQVGIHVDMVANEIEAVAIHKNELFVADVDLHVFRLKRETLDLFPKRNEVHQHTYRIDLDLEGFDYDLENIRDMVVPDNKRIVVTTVPEDHSGRIREYDLDTHRSNTTIRGLRCPEALFSCVLNGSLWFLVSDEWRKKVSLYDDCWNEEVSFSSYEETAFEQPTGIAMTTTGLVLIADFKLSCVGVFHMNGTFCRYLLICEDISAPAAIALTGSQLWVLEDLVEVDTKLLSAFDVDEHTMCTCGRAT